MARGANRYTGCDALLVDVEGYVWLREFVYADDDEPHRPWFVFDRAGVWQGRVLVPSQFEPFEIGSEYMLGRWESDLGVESVRVLALRR